MNLLPWLLDWPPRPATVVAFLLVTAFSVGTVVAFGGVTDRPASENVTVDASDVTVRLNDETDLPDVGNDTVARCLGVGTPGDSIGVLGDVVVHVPTGTGGDRHGTERLLVEVRLEQVGERTTQFVEGTGRVTASVFWILEDDETLSVGETASLRVRVLRDGETVADVGRAVRVENGSRSYDCDGSLGSRPAPDGHPQG